jgi:hypothetical protein
MPRIEPRFLGLPFHNLLHSLNFGMWPNCTVFVEFYAAAIYIQEIKGEMGKDKEGKCGK